MNAYTEENANVILQKLQSKGWNLYKALTMEDTVDPTETIRRGPASELEQDALYIILPAIEDDKNPAAIQKALQGLTKKTGGQIFLPHGDGGISLQAVILRESDVGVPVQKSTAGIPYPSFIEHLDRLYDTRLKRQINYANISPPLRGLVQKLNDIPFVYTLKSRSGRIFNEIWRDLTKEPFTEEEMKNTDRKVVARPDEEHCLLTGGHLTFKIERDGPEAAAFIKDLSDLADRYSFVKLTKTEDKWTMYTDFKDITNAHEVKPEDDFVTRVKKIHQARKMRAQKRMQEFLKVRDAIIELAEKYL